MILLTSEPFSLQKTLLIALIGAIIGQSLIIVISWIKKEIDLSRKKKMILDDLKNQEKILDELTKKYLELKHLFQIRETDQFTSSVFHILHLDIYQSVAKNELYAIFKKNLSTLVDIYKSIDFLKSQGPYWVYKDYLEKSELHLEKKKNDDNHEFYCDTHIGFIEIALKNIENHLKTIMVTKSKIKKITD